MWMLVRMWQDHPIKLIFATIKAPAFGTCRCCSCRKFACTRVPGSKPNHHEGDASMMVMLLLMMVLMLVVTLIRMKMLMIGR